MKFFILALILHGLFFLKLYIPRATIKNDIPKKHNIMIQFQEIKTIPVSKTIKIPQKMEKNMEKNEKIKEKIKKQIKANKKVIKPKTIIKKDKQIKILNQKNNENFIKNEIKNINSSNTNNILQDNKDGTYTAFSNNAIKYKILREVEPIYPKQAENINYRKKVIVKAKFLIDENGNVEDIFIVQSHKKLGFDDAVKTALKKWKFAPISYNNKIIKVYFQKEFIFNIKK